jgi:hypothetical protein
MPRGTPFGKMLGPVMGVRVLVPAIGVVAGSRA